MILRLARTALMLLILFGASGLLGGCATAQTAGKVALTPVTGVRDVVDAPLVSLTNVFEFWADRTNPTPTPRAGGGWSFGGGFDAGIGIDFSHWIFKGVSWTLGGIDYVICRSIWPNFPNGVSPWLQDGENWGSLYFPNTRALWREEEPQEYDPDALPPPEDQYVPPDGRPQTTRM